MMRAVVVDDERLAREELEALLVETGEVTIVGSCANAIQAIRTIKSTRPDVLFLDIQMPKLDGLKMMSMIDAELMPCVVFVTAYDEYAINAFEKDAVELVCKVAVVGLEAFTRGVVDEVAVGFRDHRPIQQCAATEVDALRGARKSLDGDGAAIAAGEGAL